MKLSAVIHAIEAYAPRAFQEKWDNSGLQIALPSGSDECTGVLICLDVTEAIVNEAVERGCNLIVSHHPLIFKGFKSLTGSTVQQRAAMAAVRAGVAVYSAHTSLDSTRGGVSYAMASLLGAEVTGVIEPAEGIESILTVICPRTAADDVRLILLDLGAGAPLCAANTAFTPSAPAVDNASRCVSIDCEENTLEADPSDPVPTFGIAHTPLCRITARVPSGKAAAVIAQLDAIPGASAMRYSIVPAPASDAIGLGVFATFPDAGISGSEFVERLRKAFELSSMRVSAAYRPDMKVRRIALCGGAGGEFIGRAISAGADAYVTGDVRYHDFADAAESPCAVFDIGHFESEACAKSIFYHVITKKIPNFAVYYSETETNPVKYL